MSSEYGRAREAETTTFSESKGNGEGGGENNVPGVACVIPAEQSAPNRDASGRPPGISSCENGRSLNHPPIYLHCGGAVGTTKLTRLFYRRCLSADDLGLSELHYRAIRHRLAVARLV